MSFLKKKEKENNNSSEETKDNNSSKDNVKVIKKTKIGFGRKKKNNDSKDFVKEKKKNKKIKEKKVTKDEKQKTIPEPEIETITDDFSDDTVEEQKTDINEKDQVKEWSSKKKKKILTRDMKGKPVYLEDTGEKLGIVYDMIYDKDNNLIGYKIQDKKNDSVLGFPLDQFDEGKDGLIFVQSWYTKSIKTIQQLEFKEKVSPELTTLITDDALSNEELYNIFVKHDDQMADYIEEAVALKELLNNRLNALEKQRYALKDDLMDLTEKRLIKDIDRREFSEDVLRHRNKVNILDVNIKRCKELLKRLNNTSFGKLSLQIASNINIKPSEIYENKIEKNKDHSSIVYDNEIENPYKEKYNDIKERFEQLQEDYKELKAAVEKLVEKGEI